MSKTKYDILEIDGGSYQTTLNRKYNERKGWKATNPKHVLSFMPGTVEEIEVKVGDKVKLGEELMTFRAMKMSNNILSPINGTIKKINVKSGDNVPKDEVMIELE